MTPPRTIVEKIWTDHVVTQDPGAPGSAPSTSISSTRSRAAGLLGLRARGIVSAGRTSRATADHSIPTTPRNLPILDEMAAAQARQLETNCAELGPPRHRMRIQRRNPAAASQAIPVDHSTGCAPWQDAGTPRRKGGEGFQPGIVAVRSRRADRRGQIGRRHRRRRRSPLPRAPQGPEPAIGGAISRTAPSCAPVPSDNDNDLRLADRIIGRWCCSRPSPLPRRERCAATHTGWPGATCMRGGTSLSTGEAATASNGASIRADHPIGEAIDIDVLFVCAGGNPARFENRAAYRWLRTLAHKGVAIGGVSGGAYLLARAGLLDGYRATIHWEHLPAFSEEFPHLAMERSLFVIDRDRLTCAGGIAALDLIRCRGAAPRTRRNSSRAGGPARRPSRRGSAGCAASSGWSGRLWPRSGAAGGHRCLARAAPRRLAGS